MLNHMTRGNYFSNTRTPQQDPMSPNDDPGQKNPKIPEGPGDNRPAHPDPKNQPIDVK